MSGDLIGRKEFEERQAAVQTQLAAILVTQSSMNADIKIVKWIAGTTLPMIGTALIEILIHITGV